MFFEFNDRLDETCLDKTFNFEKRSVLLDQGLLAVYVIFEEEDVLSDAGVVTHDLLIFFS